MQFAPRVGAKFYMQADPAKRLAGDIEGATHCVIEALEPQQRIAFSWFVPGTPEARVEITLSDNADGSVTASLTHTGWDRFDADDIRAVRDMLDGGWSSYVLPGLKRCAEATSA